MHPWSFLAGVVVGVVLLLALLVWVSDEPSWGTSRQRNTR